MDEVINDYEFTNKKYIEKIKELQQHLHYIDPNNKQFIDEVE